MAGECCSWASCGVVPCQCGCGTMIPAINRRQEPGRYVRGHFRRPLVSNAYPERGDKRVHILRAERALGKALPRGAQVHHVDGTKSAKSPLVICQDATYHGLLHRRTRIVRAGGDPNTDAWCSGCRRPVHLSQFYVRKTTDRRGKAKAGRPVDRCMKCAKVRDRARKEAA
jgi:hypothetical protein